MSATFINPDGSATLQISGDASQLDAALKKAISSLAGFGDASGRALERVDQAAGEAFRSVARSVDGVGDALDKAKKNLGERLFSSSSAAPTLVDQSFFSEVVNTAGIGAIKAFGRSALESFATFGAETDKMAARTGVSVEALSEYAFAASKVGAEISNVEGAMKGMSSYLDDAANGGGDALATFERLGLSVDALLSKSPEERFEAISQAVAGIVDPTTRAALAMKVFGDDGQLLLPLFAEGPDGLRKMREEARELGVSLSADAAANAAEFAETLGRLKSAAQGLSLSLAQTLAPAARTAVEFVAHLAKTFRGFADENPVFVRSATAVGAALLTFGGGPVLVRRLADYSAGFAELWKNVLRGNGVVGRTTRLFVGFADAATTALRGVELSGARTFGVLQTLGTRTFGAATQTAANVLQLSNAQAAAFAKSFTTEKIAAFSAALARTTAATKAFSAATAFATAKLAIQNAATRTLAAASALLSAATSKATLATVAHTAKTILATTATTALGVATRGLAAAFLLLQATPIGAVVAALGIGIAALTFAFTRAGSECAKLTYEYEKFVAAADKKRGIDASKFEFVANAANAAAGSLSDQDFETAARYVADLQSKYGALGISVDAATKSIQLAADAQERFNAAVRAQAVADLDAQIREQEANLQAATADRDKLQGRANSLGGDNWDTVGALGREAGAWVTFGYVDAAEEAWTKSLEESTATVDEQRQKLDDLRRRRTAILGGSTAAAFGTTEEAAIQEGADRLGAANAAASFGDAALDEQITAFFADAENADLSPLDRRIAEIEDRGEKLKDAIRKAIAPNVDWTNAAAVANFWAVNPQKVAEASAAFDQIDAKTASRVQAERAAATAAEAEKNRVERERIAASVAAAEEQIASGRLSDLERSAAAIDKETAAYKKLLNELLAVAATEEERAEIRTKLANADADATARKNELYRAASADAPTESELEIVGKYSELGALLARAANGSSAFGDAEKIASLKDEIAKAENAEAARRLEEAQKALTAAVEELSNARKDGDQKEIAEAAERLANAQSEYDSAFSTVESIASRLDAENDPAAFGDELASRLDDPPKLGSTGTFNAFAAASLATGYDRKIYDQNREQTRLLDKIERKSGVARFSN